MVHASRGRLPPASPDLRSEVAIVTGSAPRLFGDEHRRGARWATTTASSASTSSTSSRASTPTRSGSRSPAASCCRAARTTPAPSRPRPARRASRSTRRPRRRCREGHLLLQTVRSPRPVQHHRLRPGRPLPRDHRRPPGGVRQPPTTSATAACATGTWWTWSAFGLTVSGAHRASGPSSTRRPRGCAATYFPEANVLVPLDSTAEISNTPASKSIVIRLERSAAPIS